MNVVTTNVLQLLKIKRYYKLPGTVSLCLKYGQFRQSFHLFSLRGRYPWAFQDLCLYSQVMEQLGVFSYRLSIRRFIEALFERVNYAKVRQNSYISLHLAKMLPVERKLIKIYLKLVFKLFAQIYHNASLHTCELHI